MSVLIKGMEKPEHCGYCRFRYDGICHALQKTQYNMNECPLVVIDDAGLNDTISRQAAIDAVYKSSGMGTALKALHALPSAQPEQTKMIKEIRKWINSGNRGKADYFIVDKIEEIINKYE